METLIEKCKQVVEEIYNQFDASHDFAHIERVLKNADAIIQEEKSANPQVVRLAVLLHDIDDAKYQTGQSSDCRRNSTYNQSGTSSITASIGLHCKCIVQRWQCESNHIP